MVLRMPYSSTTTVVHSPICSSFELFCPSRSNAGDKFENLCLRVSYVVFVFRTKCYYDTVVYLIVA